MSSPAGNLYPKYETSNPVARRLMRGFLSSAEALLKGSPEGRCLDVGCGAGEIWRHLPSLSPGARQVLLDLDLQQVRAARRGVPGSCALVASVERLPFADRSFQRVTAFEVLEHAEDPHAALGELARVCSGRLILSVPREPIWRILNLFRGAYWSHWGNTPGHVNHWSRRSFLAFLRKALVVREVRQPFPWTMVLAEPIHPALAQDPARRAQGAGGPTAVAQ